MKDISEILKNTGNVCVSAFHYLALSLTEKKYGQPDE